MSRLSQAVGEALGAGAPLAERIPGFVARPAQQRLAVAVADAFEQRGVPANYGAIRSRDAAR